MKIHRNKLQLIASVLDTCRNYSDRGSISLHSRINGNKTREIIKICTINSLLIESYNSYFATTTKGLEYISTFQELSKMINKK